MAEKTNLDPLPSIYEIVRGHIASTGSHYGYSLSDFDAVYNGFREDEAAKEDFLQELYDALPKEA